MSVASGLQAGKGVARNPFLVAMQRLDEVKKQNSDFQKTLDQEARGLEQTFKILAQKHDLEKDLMQEEVRLQGQPVGGSPGQAGSAQGLVNAAGLGAGRQVEVTPGENVFIPESPQDKNIRMRNQKLERELSPQGAEKAGELEGIKAGAKEKAQQTAGAEQSLSDTKLFIDGLERSFSELKNNFPNIGDKGIIGIGSRLLAKAGVAFDQFPETSAFVKNIKVRANQQARNIEGGRVTDQDRQVYADALANTIENPSSENIALTADQLASLALKGADIEPTLRLFENSSVPILKDIVTRARESVSRLSPESSQEEDEYQKFLKVIGSE